MRAAVIVAMFIYSGFESVGDGVPDDGIANGVEQPHRPRLFEDGIYNRLSVNEAMSHRDRDPGNAALLVDDYFARPLLTDWEQLAKDGAFAERAREDIEAVVRAIYAALPGPKIIRSRAGSE